jgi:hypothetical protein
MSGRRTHRVVETLQAKGFRAMPVPLSEATGGLAAQIAKAG